MQFEEQKRERDLTGMLINSENLHGRRPVTDRIAGKDPRTILIIICMPSSTALLPDNTTRAAFHHAALREPVARQNRELSKFMGSVHIARLVN